MLEAPVDLWPQKKSSYEHEVHLSNFRWADKMQKKQKQIEQQVSRISQSLQSLSFL